MQIMSGWPLCGLLATSAAAASSFNVAPIRADLTAAHRMAVITLTNADAEPVVIQVQVEKWVQVDGVEHLELSREVLVTPPVLQVPGSGEQVVRLALRREPEAAHELTYRVIFQEVPQAAPKEFTLQVALSLSVPIFVAPLTPKLTARLKWDAHATGPNQLVLGVFNEGEVHAQVYDVAVDLPADALPLTSNVARYVLSGSHMSWTLTTPRTLPPHAALTVHGHATDGAFSQVIELSEH
jgi:P pilus assembly chaperone PapD